MGLDDTLDDRFSRLTFKNDASCPALDPSDPAFVLEPEYRPIVKHDEFAESANDEIPVIDLDPVGSGEGAAMDRVIREIGKAAEDWGFFQVINHGVPPELIDKLERESLAFFMLPLNEKKKTFRTFDQPVGYYNEELTKNHRDWKEVFDFAVGGAFEFPDEDGTTSLKVQNRWPKNPPGLRDAAESYAKAVEELALRLLALLSQSLGLPAEKFHKCFEDHTSVIRLNYYPVCPIPDLALGVSRHKDPGAITILVQDTVGGLQVRRSDGQWIGVRPRRDAFVVNLGAVFQMWSNDRFKSVEHQVVVNETKARVSFPMFLNPSSSTDVMPAPELLSDDSPARYQPMNYGYFFRKRGDGNFKQYGEDIQIEHFAVKTASPNESLVN